MLSNEDNAYLDKDLQHMSRNVYQVDKDHLEEDLTVNVPGSTNLRNVQPTSSPTDNKLTFQSLLDAASEWIAEQQQLERDFQRQIYEQQLEQQFERDFQRHIYEQHLRTQQHDQPDGINLIPHSSMAIQTRQALGQNITVGKKQSSKMTLVEKAVSPLPKQVHEKVTYVKVTEQLVKTFEWRRGELGKNSHYDNLVLMLSNEDNANWNKDLKEMSRYVCQDHLELELKLKEPRSANLRNVQPTFSETENVDSFQPLMLAVSEHMAEQQQLGRNSQRQTHKQQLRTKQHRQPARRNLRRSSMGIQPQQALRQNITEGQKKSAQMKIVEKKVSPLPKSLHEKITHVKETEKLEKTIEHTRGDSELCMDACRGFETQVNNTSCETYDLQSRKQRVHSAQDQKLDHLQEDLTLKVPGSKNHPYVQPTAPTGNELFFQSLLDADSEWITEQQQLERDFHRWICELKLRTQEHPQLSRLNLPHSAMTIETRQALGQNITERQKQSSQMRLVDKAMSPQPKPVHGKNTYVNETEQFEKTIEQTRRELEPGMEGIRRMNTRFSSTSYDIFGLQSYDDSDNSRAKHVPNIVDDQSFLTQPKEELSSQRVTDRIAPSIEIHQHLENRTQEQSYEQSFLTRESPKFAGLELPHLSMAMQTPQTLNKTDSQKKLTQMNLVQQSMIPLSEPGNTAMSDVLNVEQIEKTFDRTRTDLDTGIDNICSFDTPSIISIHGIFNLLSYEDGLVSEEELSLGHDQQLITPVPPKQGPIEIPDDEEIQQFVETFKKRRSELGFTQGQVALAISKMVNARVMQYSISDFENFKMPIKSMYIFKSVFQLWLEDIDTSGNIKNPNPSKTYWYNMPEFIDFRERLHKTLDVKSEIFLEKTFLEDKTPTTEKIAMIAKSLGVSKYRVRVWFLKRRINIGNSSPTGQLVSSYSAVATPGFCSPVMVPPSFPSLSEKSSPHPPSSCTANNQQLI